MPRPLTKEQIQERILLAKQKAKDQGLTFRKHKSGEFQVGCSKHRKFYFIGETPGGPKERQNYCLECAKEVIAARMSATKFSIDKAGANLQKKLDRLHRNGKGNKVKLLKRRGDQVTLNCKTHGVWKDSLVQVRDNRCFTCPECAKESQRERQFNESEKSFWELWPNRWNPSLELLENEYLGSYVKHRIRCSKHDIELNMTPNGNAFLKLNLCRRCYEENKSKDLERRHGKGVTKKSLIPGYTERRIANSEKKWGAPHYMQSGAGFDAHQHGKYKRKKFFHQRLPEVAGSSFVWCQGSEPTVLQLILDNDPTIVALSTSSKDFPKIWYYDQVRKMRRRYHLDAVTKHQDGSIRLIEAKVSHTLTDDLDVNLLKFQAASTMCSSLNDVSFHLFIVGGTKKHPVVTNHFKDPMKSKRFKSYLKELQ